MEYKQLKKLYYVDNQNFEKCYQNRFKSESSYHLDFMIGNNQAFFMTTNEMMSLAINIFSVVQKITRLEDALPPVAKHFFSLSCLIDEMNFTNQYEGVRSSRRELKEALEASENPIGKKPPRFLGLVKKYSKINEELKLITSQDVRDLYDELILPEIEKEEDKPDGKVFRKDSVSVMSATQKEAHRGLLPESKIIESMDTALKILHNENIHFIIRICIFHYLFGYIHPFYDGNGRMSRFISSYYLWHYVDNLLAYRLSYTVVNMRKDYEKAFDDCNDSHNMGDITPFILTFLNIVNAAAKDLYVNLKESLQKLKYYSQLESNIGLTEDEEKLLFIFIQNSMFSFELLDKAVLMKETEFRSTKTANLLKQLLEKDIPIIVKQDGHKKAYSLDLKKFEEYCKQK